MIDKRLDIKGAESFGSEEEYWKSPWPDYSTLKKLEDNLPVFLQEKREGKTKEKEVKEFGMGSAVDILLTHPESFDDDVLVMDPADLLAGSKIKDIIDTMISRDIIIDDKDNIVSLCREIGYNPSYKDDTLYKTIKNKGKKYYEIARESKNKVLLSSDDYMMAMQISKAMKKQFPEFFNEYQSKDREIVYQYKLKGVIPIGPYISNKDHSFTVKGMLDVVVIDHKNHTIQGIDIKTGHYYDFTYNFRKFRSYYQGTIYNSLLDNIANGYTVLGFKFIFGNTQFPDFPIQYTMPRIIEKKVFDGFTDSRGWKIKGLDKLLDDYYWYMTIGTALPRELVENNNRLILTL